MEEEEYNEGVGLMDSTASTSISDESGGEGEGPEYETTSVGSVARYVKERFKRAEDARRSDEDRWLKSYRNYRGIYGSDVQFTSTEKSKIFVKVTKVKVLAAYGQIVDVLFGNNKFPLSIEPTLLPDGVEESVHFDTAEIPEEMKKLLPGETAQDLQERLGALKTTLAPVADKLRSGEGKTPTQVTLHPAKVAAKKMEKKIHDQLDESHANKQLRSSAFECSLFGTGILKGPFALDKEYPKWDEQGNYNPLIKTIPQTSTVSVWNFYPDPDAVNMDESEFVIERHKMSRSKLRGLKNRPFFNEEEIDMAIELGNSYQRKHWETEMEDGEALAEVERFEVLEFWGNVDPEILEDYGVEIPEEYEDYDEVSVNIWVCNDRVLRFVVNPFTPALIPYYAFPYEVNPYSFFGIGIAENMEDTQILMNGFMRMAVDNAALSGNLLIEVDENNLVPGQDLSIYPGKVFKRQGGAPGQAIFGTKFPNVSNENMQMFDKARALADESTGFPSFAHGQTGVSGVGRTASGISMLMSAANGTVRSVVKNIDDYLLAPLGKAFFSFNMQFDFDPETHGDLEVKARGTESLMANEVRSQRLMQFLGIIQNPMLAPLAKIDYILREIAKSLDLDPDKVVNSLSESAIQAELFKQFQPQPTPQQGVPTEGAPAGVQATDQVGSGGGTIGTGSVPTPGTEGFSANTGEGEV